jgi:glycosyltransferase involved in cell wall biosynthesis
MFDFIKYIHPGSYERLIHQMPQAVLMDKLSNIVEKRTYYRDPGSFEMDLSYQMLQRGEIPLSDQQRNERQNYRVNNIQDNYIFVRRFFSLAQVIYVFVIRICSFKNPIHELLGLSYALFKVRRVKIEPHIYSDWETFDSKLVESNPLVSVIIPTLNRYEYLKDVLADLEKQDYQNFEVIVVDQSEPVDSAFYDCWNLNIQLIAQKERALWLARNTAITLSKGRYIALTEDDVRMRTDWISNHLKCLDYFKADASSGVFHPVSTNVQISEAAKPLFQIAQQFPTGNVLLKREIFEKIGLFDRQFEGQRMGDGEFGLRCLLNGFRVISNPMAYIIDVKAPSGGLRQMGSWDALRPKSLMAPRPVPSVLYLIRKYHGGREAIFYLIKNIPQSYIPYKFKRNKVIRITCSLIFPLLLPIALVAVLKSWFLASEKIKTGSLITKLT